MMAVLFIKIDFYNEKKKLDVSHCIEKFGIPIKFIVRHKTPH